MNHYFTDNRHLAQNRKEITFRFSCFTCRFITDNGVFCKGHVDAGSQLLLETIERHGPLGERVLDLGCGYGWHCRYAVDQGASAVVGIDISERMLQKAKQLGDDPRITYVRTAMEDVCFPPESFDVVISSLAFHYVEDLQPLFRAVFRMLAPGGKFVFSCEHPLFTAYGSQDWYHDEQGNILHFPVDHYFMEGKRDALFLGEQVIKYHHTLSAYLHGLRQAGFNLNDVQEPMPTPQMIAEDEEMRNELRRPMMLIVSAEKPR